MCVRSQTNPVVLYKNGERVEGSCVEFRLIYSGDGLTVNGSGADKHAIRRIFHPQLKQLWQVNESLRSMAEIRGHVPEEDAFHIANKLPEDIAREAFFKRMGQSYERGGFHYVPLVEKELCLRVSIDVLFLRRDKQSLVDRSGDIDNRMKTLFDALRVPDVNDGCGSLKDGEDPFFVLLQDDSLISEIRVDTDELLMLPNDVPFNSRDVFLVIHVKLKPKQKIAHAWAFE